jgi:hypothetical protein
MHIASVKAGVPASDWCDGHAKEADKKGFLARLLGR